MNRRDSRWLTRRAALLCALGVLALAFPSCPDDDGAVSIAWTFGPTHLGCDAAGVQTVHVFVGPLAPSGSYDHEVECSAGEGGLRMDGVSPGPHVLVIKGVADNNVLFVLEEDIDVEGSDLGTFIVPPYAPPP